MDHPVESLATFKPAVDSSAIETSHPEDDPTRVKASRRWFSKSQIIEINQISVLNVDTNRNHLNSVKTKS